MRKFKKLVVLEPVRFDKAAEEALFEYIKTKYPEIPESIKETRVLSDEAEQKLIQAIGECKAKFSAAE